MDRIRRLAGSQNLRQRSRLQSGTLAETGGSGVGTGSRLIVWSREWPACSPQEIAAGESRSMSLIRRQPAGVDVPQADGRRVLGREYRFGRRPIDRQVGVGPEDRALLGGL